MVLGLAQMAVDVAETILISYVGTMIGAVLAFALNFFAAQNTSPAPWLRFVIRRLLESARTVPGIVFALIFVIAFGLARWPACWRLRSIPPGRLEAVFRDRRKCRHEAGRRRALDRCELAVLHAVCRVAEVAAGYASYALLRFEINVREASVMGFVGAGGIGQELVVAIRKFYYSDVSAILMTIIVTVFIIDIATGWLRGRLFGGDARA